MADTMRISLSFANDLNANGFDFFVSVPCSFLKNLLLVLDKEEKLIYANREDEALGMACGAYLAGRKPVVLVQTSGFLQLLNGLHSLNMIYGIPVLLIVSWRGFNGNDSIEHKVTGKNFLKILRASKINYFVLNKRNYLNACGEANKFLQRNKQPFVLVVKKGVFGE
ncbi:MAG: thiamine pyrophosphate-binding protein [archaeon]